MAIQPPPNTELVVNHQAWSPWVESGDEGYNLQIIYRRLCRPETEISDRFALVGK